MKKNALMPMGAIVGIGVALWVALFSSSNDESIETSSQSTTDNTIMTGDTIPLSYQGAGISDPTNGSVDNIDNREVIATGLDAPWSLARGENNHMIVTERGGDILDIDMSNGQKTVVKTLPAEQRKGSAEAGLMGIVKDGDTLYTAYTYRKDSEYVNRLIRLNIKDSQVGTEEILLDDIPGSNNHDGGAVKLGPDGKIYRTMGDAGDEESAQNTGTFNGKILRINTDGSIPNDNPFPGSYIRSYGHRNPQGLARQPDTNTLRSTEHGPSSPGNCCRDEINIILPGNNYGWPTIRGQERQNGMISPLRISGERDTRAPAGIAFVTAGPRKGNLLIAGLRGQALYRVILDENDHSKIASVERYLHNKLGRIRDVLTTSDGTIYIITNNTDGRGSPNEGDDRLMRIRVE